MTQGYINLGLIRQTSIKHYCSSGTRMSFKSLLLYNCNNKNLLDKSHFDFKRTPGLLDDEAFLNVLNSLQIDVNSVVSVNQENIISEENVISDGKDTTGFAHMPYIDDGMHVHNHFEINYVYRGQSRQILENEQRTLREGDLCIIAPNMKHNILVDDEESIVLTVMVRKSTFDFIFGNALTHNNLISLFFRNTLYSDEQSNYLLFDCAGNINIKKLMQDIIIESNNNSKYSSFFTNTLIQQLFLTLLQDCSDTALYYGRQECSMSQNIFPLILAYVQHNYRNVTLSSLSSRFYYSPEHLSRMFKSNMNMSFNKIIQNLKMEKACELLKATDMSVSEIASYLGYKSSDYFTKCFKKHYGRVPSKYGFTEENLDY